MKKILLAIIMIYTVTMTCFGAGGGGGGTRINPRSLNLNRYSSINDFRYSLLQDSRNEVLIKDIKLYDHVALPRPQSFQETMMLINSGALESIQLTNGTILW